jgi:hypothetical protein
MDTGVFDAFLLQAGAGIVEVQIRIQAAIVQRYAGVEEAGVVPLDSPLRAAAAAAWVAQLKIWFPADVMLPPWAIAVILPAMAIPVQIAGARQRRENEAAGAERPSG